MAKDDQSRRYVVEFTAKGKNYPVTVYASTEADAVLKGRALLPADIAKTATFKRATVNYWSGDSMKVRTTKDAAGNLHVYLDSKVMRRVLDTKGLAGVLATVGRGTRTVSLVRKAKDADKPQYVIRFDPTRHKRTGKGYGVFRVEPGLNRGISVHASEAEAKAAIPKDKAKDVNPETPTKLTPAQKRDLAELEEKAKGDYMTPGDRERLVRLRKLKAAYGNAHDCSGHDDCDCGCKH